MPDRRRTRKLGCDIEILLLGGALGVALWNTLPPDGRRAMLEVVRAHYAVQQQRLAIRHQRRAVRRTLNQSTAPAPEAPHPMRPAPWWRRLAAWLGFGRAGGRS